MPPTNPKCHGYQQRIIAIHSVHSALKSLLLLKDEQDEVLPLEIRECQSQQSHRQGYLSYAPYHHRLASASSSQPSNRTGGTSSTANASLPPSTAAPPTSSRPKARPDIRSPEYQKRAMQCIIDYLRDSNYGQVTRQMLRGLTLRNFQNMFQHLHHHMVPSYEYVRRKFEDEYVDILRSLR